jgi:GT2 family glycosyltransferase
LSVPKCVIVIPAYNAATTVAETLLSLQQTPGLSDIVKVVMLDDCSTDDTVLVARAAWTSSTPFEVWSNDVNMGERRTVNRAFAQLGDEIQWTFILHSDDVVKPAWIELYMAAMQSVSDNTASICSSYDAWWPDIGRVVPGEDVLDELVRLVPGNASSLHGTLERGCWWHISGCAIRNASMRAIEPFDPDMPQLGDWEWVLRCHAKGFDIAYIPRTTMLYRLHSTSISSTAFREGRDLGERMRTIQLLRKRGSIDRQTYRSYAVGTLGQITRRLLVRFIRRDWTGFRAHLKIGYLAARSVVFGEGV